MRHIPLALAALVSIGCLPSRTPTVPSPATIPAVRGAVVTPYAMRHIDVRVGTGDPMTPRRCVYAHYTGWLTDGTKFDSSRDTMPNGAPREPIAFPQGARRVIAGWDAGFEGMRVGGQRRLFIPYQIAYGEPGRPPVIPPKATLIFDIELLALADTLPAAARGDGARPAPTGPQCPSWTAVSGR